MNFYNECYQKALEDIKLNRLNDAKKKLETILEQMPFHAETNWALGLVEAAIGLPHSALNRWSRADGVPASKVELLESKLSAYEELYSQYNEALHFIKNENYDEALEIFEQLINHEKQLPLPIEFYRGYYLLLLLKRKANLLLTKLSEAPGYIQTASEILPIKRKALRIKRTRKKSLITGAAVLLVSFGVSSQYDLQKESAARVLKQETVKEIGNSSPPDFEKINALEEEKSSLEAQLSQYEEKLEKRADLESILTLSETNPEKLTQRAAIVQYNKGRALSSEKAYEEAIKVLQSSYELDKNSYFSDDNLYLLIKAKKELKDDRQAKLLIDAFLSEESNHFIKSPYYDDLLLARAEYHAKEGNNVQAIETFNFIIDKYPQNWTAIEAKRMKDRVEETE